MEAFTDGNTKKKLWYDAMVKAGHDPALEADGNYGKERWKDLDYFVHSQGFHNGPGCKKCGWNTCWHCNDISIIPKCDGS